MTTLSQHEFTNRARRLWTVWVFLRAASGNAVPDDVSNPNTLMKLPRADLSRLLRGFRSEVFQVLTILFGESHGYTQESVCAKFGPIARQFVEAIRAGQLFKAGRIHAFEREFGRLVLAEGGFDTPPYGEILLQGFEGFTIRYPEYHLADDICYLHTMLCVEQTRIEESNRTLKPHCTQHFQTLARAVIVACYNLLEAVPNGFAAGWRLTHPGSDDRAVSVLEGPRTPLWKRFVSMPAAVSGNAVHIDTRSEPFNSLFWRLKRRRDYLVHCAPEADPFHPVDAPGVEDEKFNDIPKSAVEETMDATFSAIRAVWLTVYGRAEPSWLPQRNEDGCYVQRSFLLK